jgi:hypothetical protein
VTLTAARTTGLGWIAVEGSNPGRFFAGVISDAGAGGGTLTALGGADLALGASFPFTDTGDAPAIGSAAATLSVAGVGDKLAVVWTNLCSLCSVREVFLTVVGATGGRPFGEVQVSEPSTIAKDYPHVVFDGQTLAVAWLEFESAQVSRVRLRRFDPTLAPVGTALDVGPPGGNKPGFNDIDLVAPGPGEYGVAMALAGDRQSFTHITCSGN